VSPAPGRPPFTSEQAAAVADRSGSGLLAANAGSGKTAVMVERFAEAVRVDGIPVGGILALTFT
jgi:ATP-dependent helicase/nuclease subunit A